MSELVSVTLPTDHNQRSGLQVYKPVEVGQIIF